VTSLSTNNALFNLLFNDSNSKVRGGSLGTVQKFLNDIGVFETQFSATHELVTLAVLVSNKEESSFLRIFSARFDLTYPILSPGVRRPCFEL
jgi:hypothetical protein